MTPVEATLPTWDEAQGPLPGMLLALTVVSGLVDAASYLLLGHVFVANMTGNVLFLGFVFAGVSGFSLPSVVLAIVAFAVGAAAGGRITARLRHRGRALWTVALLEVTLLAAAAAIAVPARAPVGGWPLYATIGVMAIAMGARNAVVRWLAVPDLTTTVLTMTVTGIAADSPTGAGAVRLRRRLLSVAAMLLGGFAGAQVVLHGSTLAFLLPPLVLLAVCIRAVSVAGSQATWTAQGRTSNSQPNPTTAVAAPSFSRGPGTTWRA
jgi:uncharacterized membrane protein YoaK (UPF0700 family)